MCWKYKLLKPFYKNTWEFPICCVGCKYGKNMKCIKKEAKLKEGGEG